MDREIADYTKAIELEPNNWLAFFNQGLAYKGLGKKAEAIAAFEKVLSLSKGTSLIEQAKQKLNELRQ